MNTKETARPVKELIWINIGNDDLKMKNNLIHSARSNDDLLLHLANPVKIGAMTHESNTIVYRTVIKIKNLLLYYKYP